MRKKWQNEFRRVKIASLSVLAAALLMASSVPASAAYLLSIGDTIGVTVFGQVALNRKAEIDGSGKIWLPTIGRIPAAGRTLEVLRAQIIDLLRKDESVRVLDINVEIAGFRPVFVEGAITNPGAYPYHMGMTVRQSVALAGGQTRAGQEAVDQQGQLRGLWLSYVQRHARIARLKAELSGNGKINWTPPEGSPIEQSVIDNVRELEKNQMQLRLLEFKEKMRQLDESIKFSKNEIKEFREQMVWADNETERMTSSVAKLQNLQRRGLVPVLRVSQGTQALYLVRFRAGQMKLGMDRAKRKAEELVDQRKQLTLARHKEISDQLQLDILEGDRLRQQVTAAQNKLRAMDQTAQTSCATSESEEIVIHRSVKGKIERVSTHRDHSVLPGDVVEVRLFDPSQSARCRNVLAGGKRQG